MASKFVSLLALIVNVSAFYHFRMDQANWLRKGDLPAPGEHHLVDQEQQRMKEKVHTPFRPSLRGKRSDTEDELVEALLKRVEGVMFYVQDPSPTLEEFFVSAIQIAAKYKLEYLVRKRIILFEIKETPELQEIIENNPGGSQEDFAEGIINWAEKYKTQFEELEISGGAAMGKIVALAFNDEFRDADAEERRSWIREILRSRGVKHDTLKLPTDEE